VCEVNTYSEVHDTVWAGTGHSV